MVTAWEALIAGWPIEILKSAAIVWGVMEEVCDTPRLKIAQVAPLYESVPPKLYGGTERVVSYLTDTLAEMGHEVTLFASGDSRTRAKLHPMCQRALRLDERSVDPHANHVLLAEKIFQEAGNFDVIHSHIDYGPFSLWRRTATPHVTTLHGRLDIPNLQDLYREFRDEPVVSISGPQRGPLPFANWQATVHHGLPENLYTFHQKPGHYLAFLGRISPEKGIDDAIAVAKRAGLPLKIAAKVDKVDREYFETVIRPLLYEGVEFIGEIGEQEKNEFLGNALALLFMIDWPEPFGLAMIESFACGTPVVARARGSVPEIIEHGKTGYIVRGLDEAVQALKKIPHLHRNDCRQAFATRFTARRMADDYIAVYQQLLKAKRANPASRPQKAFSIATSAAFPVGESFA